MAVGYSVPLGRSLGFVRDDSAKSSSLNFSFHIHNLLNHKYYADAWLWRAYFQQDDLYYAETGLYPQAPMNFMFKVGLNF